MTCTLLVATSTSDWMIDMLQQFIWVINPLASMFLLFLFHPVFLSLLALIHNSSYSFSNFVPHENYFYAKYN